MGDYAANINFTFIEPPASLNADPEDESTFPVIKVDVSGSDMVIQALLLRILSLVRIESRNRGAEYIFEVK